MRRVVGAAVVVVGVVVVVRRRRRSSSVRSSSVRSSSVRSSSMRSSSVRSSSVRSSSGCGLGRSGGRGRCGGGRRHARPGRGRVPERARERGRFRSGRGSRGRFRSGRGGGRRGRGVGGRRRGGGRRGGAHGRGSGRGRVATAATGSVAPATGRSAAAVDVAMLQADTKAASVRRRELRRTRRVPCGPIGRSCRRVRSCGPRRYNGFPQAWRRRSCCTCSSPRWALDKPCVQRSNMPLIGHLAPLEAAFHGSERAQRSLQQGRTSCEFGLAKPSEPDSAAARCSWRRGPPRPLRRSVSGLRRQSSIGRIAAHSSGARSSVEGLRRAVVDDCHRAWAGCDPSAWRVSQRALVEVPRRRSGSAFDATPREPRQRRCAASLDGARHAPSRARHEHGLNDARTQPTRVARRRPHATHFAPTTPPHWRARHARGEPSDAADTGLETPLTRHSFRVDDAPSAAPARRSKRPLGCRRHGWLDGSAQPLTVPAASARSCRRQVLTTPARALERARCDSHRPPGGSPDTPPGEVLHDPSAGCRDVCSAGSPTVHLRPRWRRLRRLVDG